MLAPIARLIARPIARFVFLGVVSALLAACNRAAFVAPQAHPGESLDRGAIVARHFGGRSVDPRDIEGIWRFSDGNYEIAIVRNKDRTIAPGDEYIGIILDSKVIGWSAGKVKLTLNDGGRGRYSGSYYGGAGTIQNLSYYRTAEDRIEMVIRVNDSVQIGNNALHYDRNQRIAMSRSRGPEVAVATPPTRGESRGGSSGSGFFIGQGLIATNQHVVDTTPQVFVEFDGRRETGKVLVTDPANDLALIQLNGSDAARIVHTCFDLSTPNQAAVGDRIYAMGFPLVGDLTKELRITEGIVNALSGLNNARHVFQMSAQIQPGNSGGPVVDALGRLVGVSVSSADDVHFLRKDGTVPQNINFAIKNSYLLALMQEQKATACAQPIRPAGQPLDARGIVTLTSRAVVFIDNPGTK